MTRSINKGARQSRRGRVPASEVESRNLRILDSATEVFLESGFAKATMTSIAKKAGCSLETLYTTYPNKEAMFGALIARKAAGTFDAVGPLSADRDHREGLITYALEMLAMMAKPDTKGLHKLVIGESRSFPEVARNFWTEGYGRGLEVVSIYLGAKKKRAELPIEDTVQAARVFLALLLGDMIMRSTLGIKTLSDVKKHQVDWAEKSVDLFLALIDQRKL